MRGSGAFRTSVAPGGALAGPWVRNALWRNARAVPSLDLDFAGNKSLKDGISNQDLITHTRASSATFVDSSGVLRSAVTNLLLRSEEFGTTWAVAGTAAITANQETAPNNTLTADLLTTTSGGPNRVVQAGVATTSTTYTSSVYVKAGNINGLTFRLFFSGGTSVDTFADFVFASGAFTAINGVGSFAAQNVGGGWFRISCTIASGNNTAWEIRIGGLITTAQTGTTAYLWGAQLEQSSTVGDYVPTTSTINSAPRFDHNPTTGESLGLLVEEARTNLALRSEDFATTWTLGNATVPVSGQTTPAGTTNANSLTGDGNNSTHLVSQSVTFTAAVHTLSVYAKKGTNNFLQIRFGATAIAAGIGFANFNLDTGVVGTVGAGISGSSITAAGNGWYRCSITGTTLAAASNVGLYLVTSATAVSAELNTLTTTVNIWGAQLEAGAVPTSYIPTTTATVTRAADVAQITGSNFSSWYNQTEGTVFAEGNSFGFSASNYPTFATISDGSSNNRLQYGYITNNSGGYLVSSGGSIVAELYPALSAHPRRAAFAAVANNYAVSYNGASPTIDTAGNMPIGVNQMQIGNLPGAGATNNFFGTIKRLTYWPTRLSNQVLQRITQP